MLIDVAKCAKECKIKTPDLITRPVGRKMYAYASKLLQNARPEELVIIDFTLIKVIDPSFIDEFIISILREAYSDQKPLFIKLTGLSNASELNIASVFDSYSSASGKPFAIITDSMTEKREFFIGNISPVYTDIIHYLRVNRNATAQALAAFLNTEPGTAAESLAELYALRLIRRDEQNQNIYLSL